MGCVLASRAAGQGQGPAGDDAAARRAAEFLQAAAESLKIEADDADNARLALRKSPIFKYSDPARGYSAAGIWRLGQAGRPQAIVSLEYWLRAETDEPRLMYELVSLTDAPFTVSSARAKLPAHGPAPKFAALMPAEKPAAGERQRLVQLRALARRFTVSEKHMGDFAALRLLPQPIDRYDDASAGIVDGGLFVFVYGTNPEAALWLEADKEGWRYALSRMTWAEVVVELDGKEVARFDQLTGFPASGPYRSAGHVIEAPPNPEP
ncbi:MAG: hypothetical protein L0211_12630 [Planctomycetaceae bacterium]|nr:hypothetical protein [Planctomycetaceae bacterium]